MSDEIKYSDINKSFEAAVERSKKIEADLNVNPKKYKYGKKIKYRVL